MHTAGLEGNQHVPCLLGIHIQDLALIHNAHCKAGYVIFILRIEARHFCCFTAYQCAAGLYTALCHAGNDGCYLFRYVFAQCDVVQEELRFCAAANDVVDAHCHTVDTDCGVLVHQKGDFQLCSYAVCTGNQYRLLHSCHIQCIEAAEAADVCQNVGCHSSGNVGLHQFHCLVTGSDVYACLFIAFRIAFHLCVTSKVKSY